MMLPWARQSPVGCDFGHSAVKLVKVKRRGDTWTVTDAELRDLTPSASSGNEWPSREAIQAASGCPWVRGQDVSVSLQGRPPLIRHLSLPPMPSRELREALQWEAKKADSHAVEELVIDYVSGQPVATEQGRMVPVTMVVAERQAVETEFGQYRAGGLCVKVMDVNPVAFFHAAHRLGRDQTGPGCVALVDIGASRTDINIVKQGSLRFSRSVPLAGDSLTEGLARSLGIDFAQAETIKREQGLVGNAKVSGLLTPDVDRLIVEIQRSVDYYRAQSHDGSLEALWVGGGTALTPGLVEYLGRFFDTTVRLFDPFEGMDCLARGFDVERVGPRFVSSVGLAVAGLA